MWKYKAIGVALFLKAFVGKLDFEAARLDVPQSKRFYELEMVNKIQLPEISGLTTVKDEIVLLTDSGGEPALYFLNNDRINDTLNVAGTSNIDWETLTADNEGNFYVGDIGNNSNRRKNLRIYKFNKILTQTDTISISYAQQKSYPPDKKEKNYDCEAMFWHQGKLHLFSKNRGRKCVKHYMLNDKKGSYELTPVEELKLNAEITGATVSPSGEVVALLAYGKIYFFRMNGEKIFSQPLMLIESTRFGQNEAITFLDENTLLISNEAGKFFKVGFSLPVNK